MALAVVRDITSQLYDTHTRPSVVAKGLVYVGAEKVLSPKHIELVASLTTVQALREKGVELQGVAMPYLEKVRQPDGRKELVLETHEKILKPTREVVAPYVQPYVDSANERIIKPTYELAAPYVEKLAMKRNQIRESPRYQAAVAQLQAVREHPMEVAHDLKAKAVDLVRYDDLVAYRAYVQSPEFQADTLKLIREDLPAIARDAARRGMELVHSKATALNTEVQAKRAALVDAWKKGYEKGFTVDLEEMRARALALIADLQTTLASKVEAVKATDYNPQEVIALLKKIFGLDAYFKAAPAEAPAADAPETTPAASTPSELSPSSTKQ